MPGVRMDAAVCWARGPVGHAVRLAIVAEVAGCGAAGCVGRGPVIDEALAAALPPRPRNTLVVSLVATLDGVDMEALAVASLAATAVLRVGHHVNVDEELR